MKNFQRKIEDFTCLHCGLAVSGGGYTNHCPRCLWSQHVDINPGDRLNTCQGMMKPIQTELDHGEQILIHKCEKCGSEKRNKIAPEDNIEQIIKLASGLASSTDF